MCLCTYVCGVCQCFAHVCHSGVCLGVSPTVCVCGVCLCVSPHVCVWSVPVCVSACACGVCLCVTVSATQWYPSVNADTGHTEAPAQGVKRQALGTDN